MDDMLRFNKHQETESKKYALSYDFQKSVREKNAFVYFKIDTH